jgi:inward rectifier potassium channel
MGTEMGESSAKATGWRLLNRDRSFNVELRHGIKAADLYHSLLSTSWPLFVGFIFTIYLLVNVLFGLAYFSLGPNALMGIEKSAHFSRFVECFFFSIQTVATIGYGRVSPVSLGANLLVTVEALIGLMGLAIATGLFFARFARPTARVRFSRVALVGIRNGQPCLTLRMANERQNQIVEATATLAVLKSESTQEGQKFRRIHDLKLERSKSPLFSLSWTLIHPITPESPLYGLSREDLVRDEAEVFVSLVGMDDTFSATIHDRYSYLPSDLVWNAKFKDVLTRNSDGRLHLNLEDFHAYEPV